MRKLIKEYPALISFGILTAAFSAPGQTFLVSIFIPHMETGLGLSKSNLAGIYSLATLASGFLLTWNGKLLDKVGPRIFSSLAAIGLAFGCFFLSRTQGIIMLFCGFFLIRNLGQGSLSLTSSTTMARIFGQSRGRALGLASLGYPLSEAIFPSLVAISIAHYGWRNSWVFLGALTLLFFLPLVQLLISKDLKPIIAIEHSPLHPTEPPASTAFSQVLKDPRFYFIIGCSLVPPALFTALFFYQAALFAWKGWSLTTAAAGFAAYGASRAISSVLTGFLIDRFGAAKIFPFNLFPLLPAFLFYLFGQQEWCGFAFLLLAGITMGMSMPASSALFAEMFGIEHLGQIRGLSTAAIILSTAAAPFLMGLALDASIRSEWILVGVISLTCLGIVSAFLGVYLPAKKVNQTAG